MSKVNLKDNRVAISIGIFVLVFLPVSFYGIYYFYSSIKEKSSVIQTASAEKDFNELLVQDVSSLKLSSQQIDANINKLNVYVEDTAQAKINLYGEIEEIARQTGNTNVSYRVVEENTNRVANQAKAPTQESEIVKIEPVQENHIRLEVEMLGTYENFMGFLKKIENYQYFIDVQNLSLVKYETGEGSLRPQGTRQLADVEADDRDNLVSSTVQIIIYLKPILGEEAATPINPEDPNAEVNTEDIAT